MNPKVSQSVLIQGPVNVREKNVHTMSRYLGVSPIKYNLPYFQINILRDKSLL